MEKEIDGVIIEIVTSTEIPYGFDCGVCYLKDRCVKSEQNDCHVTPEEGQMGIVSKHWEVKK